MSLRERFAAHGLGRLSEGTGVAEPLAAEAGRAGLTASAALDLGAPTVPRGTADMTEGTGHGPPAPAGPGERLVVAPELRARGTAYGHGIYRLFVHGRAARKPFELPRVSGVDSPLPAPPRAPAAIHPPTPGAAPQATRSSPRAPSQTAPPPPLAPPTVFTPPDLLALGPDQGGFLRRVVHWPHAHAARPALLGGALARLELPALTACQAMLPRLLARPVGGAAPLVFLDVETTALDRGAGALAFMIGLAVLVDGGVQVEQWILTRLSSEAAMLADLLTRLTALAGAGAVLASFNGASFDLPLLRTRLRRAGLSAVALERPHLDLLPPARRMWRGHGSDCRLVTLERTQLAVRRVHDIEGHEIPAVFWAWLRRPDDLEVQAVMRRVADHNLADLVTLPALAAALYARITAPPNLNTTIQTTKHHLTTNHHNKTLTLLKH